MHLIPCLSKDLLVACIARLNSVANFRRKGRDDLRVDVLRDAVDALRLVKEAEADGAGAQAMAAGASFFFSFHRVSNTEG